MIKLGFLISGNGSNMKAVLSAITEGRLEAVVPVVISNNEEAKGLEISRALGIESIVLDHRTYKNRKDFDRILVSILKTYNLDYIVLAGFMRIISEIFLDAFPMRIINIHPSLLPAFPGLNAQAQALNYGVRITGCTVHFVDKGIDTGPIIAQVAVPVLLEDTEETLRERLLIEEHKLLPRVLQWLSKDLVKFENNNTRIITPQLGVFNNETII